MSSALIENRKSRWLGVVLAGGRSSRMGLDKRGLILNGKTLLERSFGLLEGVVGEGNVLVSGSVPGNPSAVPDVEKELGPIGGMRSILLSEHVRDGDWILLVPVDMPGLNAEVIRELKLAVEGDGGNIFSGFQFEERELPIAFRISSSVRQAVTGLCQSGKLARERSLRSLWRQLGVRSLSLPTKWESCFVNLNTKEDWDGFLYFSGEK